MAKAPSRRGAGKAKGGKAGAKKSAPSKPTKRLSQKKAAPIKGGIPVTCSECYSDFMMKPNPSQDAALVCPICMHQGEIPEADVMGQIRMAVARAKSSSLMAAIPAVLLVVVGFAAAIMNASAEPVSETVNYCFLGGLVVLLLASIVLAMKHEKSRVEVYF